MSVRSKAEHKVIHKMDTMVLVEDATQNPAAGEAFYSYQKRKGLQQYWQHYFCK
jgi:hypothetical protein